jgi:hypothetical protein
MHGHPALLLRGLGAALIQDSHPNDRGPKGTHMGAILTNGNLYCPATPKTLLELGPLSRCASTEQTTAHDQWSAELSRYKLPKITGYDHDGYHRVSCPAVQGKLRCELRPSSMELPHTRPQVLTAPEHPLACCSQQTLTVGPSGRLTCGLPPRRRKRRRRDTLRELLAEPGAPPARPPPL